MFNVGDKIVCINNHAHINQTSNKIIANLTLGKIYSVIKSKKTFVHIINDDNYEDSFLPKRFKLAEQTQTKEQVIQTTNESIKQERKHWSKEYQESFGVW